MSIKIVSSNAFLVGCCFHFKQANHRKMKKLGMNFMVIEVLLLMLDCAPSLAMDEMIIMGVPYLNF